MKPLRIFATMAFFLAVPHFVGATTYSVLAHFNSTTGHNPQLGSANQPPRGGRLIQAPDGNFYGTTTDGGSLGYGTIFKMIPAGTLTVMANFNNNTTGKKPYSIMRADDGNFYGTTLEAPVNGESTAFKMTPDGTLTTLANFNATTGYMSTGLIQGSDGLLYGTCTTYGTGSGGNGSFFKLTTAGVLTTLFTSFNSPRGIQPFDTLVQASDGNFYGTTYYGGSSNRGTVYKITTGGALTTILSFANTNGSSPRSGLVLGSDGDLYGATEFGGSASSGTIFKITTTGDLTTLVHFNGMNGTKPQAGLIQGSDGNFYGTTPYYTFISATLGTIFKMTPEGTLTTLMTFPSGQTSGRLLQGSDGSFYGTTDLGGTSDKGTAFRFNATSSENVTFTSAASVPITTTAFTITGSALNVSLNFAPTAGALTVINNTGAGAINGRFTNLSDGGTITATYNSVTYSFTANYAGGDGNDLTLTLNSPIAPGITSASGTVFTAGLTGSFNVTATGNPAPTYSATGLPAWASLNSSTGVLGGTPPTTGPSSYPVTLTAANGTAPDATQNFTLGIIAPFAQWKAQPGFFTTEQLAEPAISGPSATPQHDGYSNLLKYIFNINPARPMSSTDRTALPAMAIDRTTTPGTPYLTLTFRQYSLMTGTTINLQTSTDLITWATVTPDLSGQTGTDANTGDPIMRVGVKTNDAPKLFMRFNVTQP